MRIGSKTTSTKKTDSGSDQSAIVVLTSATIERILSEGGSSGWVLNPNRAKHARYLVCCRNDDWANRKDGAPHRAAFLVGRISGLRQLTDESKGFQRFLVEISDYARVMVLDAWQEGIRNPVAYRTLKDVGIPVERLKFEPILARTAAATPQGMTIAEAKKALATAYGVSPENIEIIIRG